MKRTVLTIITPPGEGVQGAFELLHFEYEDEGAFERDHGKCMGSGEAEVNSYAFQREERPSMMHEIERALDIAEGK